MENKKTKEEHIADKAEYCRRAGLNYKTFQKWKWKDSPENVDWKPIQIQEELEESKSIFELRLSDNWKLETTLGLGHDSK